MSQISLIGLERREGCATPGGLVDRILRRGSAAREVILNPTGQMIGEVFSLAPCLNICPAILLRYRLDLLN